MLNSKPISTTMDRQVDGSNFEGELVDATLYRQAIRSLMYLSVRTRPDISFAVSRLAQYVEKPTTQLWTFVKLILRYISGTRRGGELEIKKQGCVAQSSSEAEYIALSAAVKEAIWIQSIFTFVIPDYRKEPIPILVDNQGSIKMAKNDASGTRTNISIFDTILLETC
eukprot:IDg4980t1